LQLKVEIAIPLNACYAWPMILGLDDIAGGQTIFAFLTWVVLTGLFYLVGYLAALNVIDDLTQNGLQKIPAMIAAAAVVAVLMSIFSYKPLVLFPIMAFANYFRVKKFATKLQDKGITINYPLFYSSSYLYITLVPILALYFQSRVWLPE
jgi:hypothetical protein